MITPSTTILEAAEGYYSLGFLPIPLYGLRTDGTCQCGRAECRAAGKHPVGANWTAKAPRDLDTIREVFRSHRGNIGIYLDSRYVLIDADGQEGLDTLSTFGQLPYTFAQQSGSGEGGHLVFRLAADQSAERITDRRFAPGVDVKVRGQFVAAPSKHKSGGVYEIVAWAEPAVLPAELYARVVKPAAAGQAARPLVARTPGAYETVRAYVAKMDPAVSGQGGHNQAYKVACKIVAQGLTEEEEKALFTEYSDRCDPPWSEAEIDHKLRDARRNSTSAVLRLVDTQSEDPPSDVWQSDLKYDPRNGALFRLPSNVVLILQNDPRWAGKIRKDVFVENYRLTDPPWSDHYKASTSTQYWTDSDTIRLQAWLFDSFGVNMATKDLEAAVNLVAEASAYNSAKDWFDGLTWDGVERVGSWLHKYLGVQESEYASRVGTWWLISAVARACQPGCKVDHMLILHGEQGKGKSSAAGILAGPQWFSDTPLTIGDKDAYLSMDGKLIVEMAELEALNRAESTAIKSFVSSRTDRYRPPYARRAVDVPRRCVFVGTTNHDEILKDDTGDRRFWPVSCGDIDRAGLARDREQLWAEATALYKAGQPWHPVTTEDKRLCEQAQSEYKTVDPWQSVIAAGYDLNTTDRTTVENVLTEVLSLPKTQWNQGVKNRVAKCLVQLGWRPKNDTGFDGHRRRYYERG